MRFGGSQRENIFQQGPFSLRNPFKIYKKRISNSIRADSARKVCRSSTSKRKGQESGCRRRVRRFGGIRGHGGNVVKPLSLIPGLRRAKASLTDEENFAPWQMCFKLRCLQLFDLSPRQKDQNQTPRKSPVRFSVKFWKRRLFRESRGS